MFRDILVHVDGSESGRRRLHFAVDFALRSGARLSGVHVTPPAEVPPRYKPTRVADIAAHLSSQLALDAQAAATAFSEEVAGRLADSCWFSAEGDIAEGISNRARYTDLVILGQNDWQGSPEAHPLPIAHSVVLRCGRPVLVVPSALQSSAIANIVVAWNGSREPVRAIHDALPLLRLSRSVQILTVTSRSAADSKADAENLFAHLTKHGVKIGSDVLQLSALEDDHLLLEQIKKGPYDLVVMGAYSHPAWMFIFGGVTQSVLLSSKIPVLVSH
jgi:nucleotide-binding universal stress UspA family protein